ncbi:MAG: hypothetical protein JXR05_08480 [Flavobacteriaceae bacterium]
MRKFLTFLLFVIFAHQSAKSQYFTHDIGFHAGTATIQTDYGVRDNFLSSYGNSAVSLSFTHTLHFFNKDPRWNSDHKLWSYLALRSELNIITNANFQHHGPFIIGNTDLARDLRAMTGTTSITSVGFQLEYYMRCLKDFIYPWSTIKWNPYVLAGVQFSKYNNTLTSTQGDWRQDITVLPRKWRTPGAIDIGKGSTYAVTFGGGVRYKFKPKIDFNLQFNWQFFLSDAVDGLQANVFENKNNEWLINLQMGVIYHLNYDRALSFFKLF